MRAKLRLTSITKYENSEQLEFNAIGKKTAYPPSGADEDNTYAVFTPYANLKMGITNPALIGTFNAGETYYVDFTLVPKTET